MGGVGEDWFPRGFEGCADGCRFSMRGRLLALFMKRRELGSGIYLPPSLFLSFPPVLLRTDHLQAIFSGKFG